jgi:gluconokinase
MLILVMGVSGVGKSTIGAALAQALGYTFADADDYHLPANKEKLTRGEQLTDADRQPWLERLHQLMAHHALKQHSLVLACSALKSQYRQTLIGNLKNVEVVFLHGSPATIEARMQQRQHFMPVSLLQSQLATLEPPENAIALDIEKSVLELISEIKARLKTGRKGSTTAQADLF